MNCDRVKIHGVENEAALNINLMHMGQQRLHTYNSINYVLYTKLMQLKSNSSCMSFKFFVGQL